MTTQRGIRLETAAHYEIRVQGSLDTNWFDRLGDTKIRVETIAR